MESIVPPNAHNTYHLDRPEYILDAEQVWRQARDLQHEYGRVTSRYKHASQQK